MDSATPAGAAAPALRHAGQLIRRDVLATSALLPPSQRPRGVLFTTRTFTVERGELTSNLKLRRDVVEKEFAAHLQRLFAALEAQTDRLQERGRDDEIPLLVVSA